MNRCWNPSTQFCVVYTQGVVALGLMARPHGGPIAVINTYTKDERPTGPTAHSQSGAIRSETRVKAVSLTVQPKRAVQLFLNSWP